jgi:hypothetical protein
LNLSNNKIVLASTVLMLGLSMPAKGDPITATRLQHLRSVFGEARISTIEPGDYFVVGAVEVTPNAANGTTGTAFQNGTTVNLVPGVSVGILPNQFNAILPASQVLANGLTGSWALTFKNGDDVVTVNTPTALNPSTGTVAPALPFVRNVTAEGNGTTPTIRWTYDTSAPVNTFLVDIRDNANLGTVFVATLGSDARSFTLPTGVLNPDAQYTIRVAPQLNRPFSPGTNSVLSRTSTYIEYNPTINSPIVGSPVFLPTVDRNGVFHFDFDVVSRFPMLVDPVVAVGYDFAIGAGDPNFASVLLPTIGDGLYDLWLYDDAGIVFDSGIDIQAGDEFDFTTMLSALGVGAEGLSRFRILGIETEAGLDPTDPTAFATALEFVADGTFTGTMAAITVDVSEPASLATFGTALLGWWGVVRGRSRRHRQAGLKGVPACRHEAPHSRR